MDPSGPTVEGGFEEPDRLVSSRDLRVCLASPMFHPEYAGSALRFRRYAPGLLDRGIRLHVVAAAVGTWKSYRQYSLGTASSGEEGSVDDWIHVERVPMPKKEVPRRIEVLRNRWVYESAVVDWCLDPSTRPDLLVWLELSPMSAPNLIRLRRAGLPMVSVDTMFSHPTGSGWKPWIKRVFWPLRYRLVDCIAVSSRVMLDALREFGVDTRAEVIPHGVDLTRFKPASDSPAMAPMRRDLGIEPESEIVLFLGPVNERKGLNYLAEAWDEVAEARPAAHLVIVGPERTEDKDEVSFGDRMRATLASGRGAERVHFVGRVDDVEAYLQAADLFVFPSLREGMPNVVCEALSCGVACVLTPFIGLSDEIGRPDVEYVLVRHESDALARAIVNLLADSDRRLELGRAGRRWAERHLDLRHSLDAYARMFRELVHPTSDRAS